MTTWPVLLDDWQIECCGDPPAVGQVVAWTLGWQDAESNDLPDALHVRRTLTVGHSGGDGTGVLLSAGGLTAWLPGIRPPAGRLVVRGLLREDHHGDLPEGLPPTMGRVRRIRIMSRLYEPTEDARVHRRVPGMLTLRDVERAPKYFASRDVTDPWGETGVLVDLDVPDVAR